MIHKIEMLLRIFRCIYEMIFVSLLLRVFHLFYADGETTVLNFLLLIGCYALSYIIREIAPNYILIVVFHLLMAVGLMFTCGYWLNGAVSAAFVICYLLPASLTYAKRGSRLDDMSEPWPSILTGVLIYIAGLLTNRQIFYEHAYLAVVGMLAVYFIIRYIQGLRRYATQTEHLSGLPMRNIISVNSKVILLITGIMLLLMFACRYLKVAWLVNGIVFVVSNIIRIVSTAILFVMLFFITLLTKGTNAFSDTSYQETAQEYYSNYAVSDPFAVILKIFVIALLLFFFYKMIVAAFRFLSKPRVFEGDVVETVPNERPQIERTRIAHRKEKRQMTEEQRARQIYRKTILKHKADIVLSKYTTCEDIQSAIKEGEYGDVDEITELYEKIRYGTTPVDGTVLRTMIKGSRQDGKARKGNRG